MDFPKSPIFEKLVRPKAKARIDQFTHHARCKTTHQACGSFVSNHLNTNAPERIGSNSGDYRGDVLQKSVALLMNPTLPCVFICWRTLTLHDCQLSSSTVISSIPIEYSHVEWVRDRRSKHICSHWTWDLMQWLYYRLTAKRCSCKYEAILRFSRLDLLEKFVLCWNS